MNLFVSVTDDVLGDCTSDGGLNYQAPADKVFLLTYIDCVGSVPQGVYLWTNRRGVLMALLNNPYMASGCASGAVSDAKAS